MYFVTFVFLTVPDKVPGTAYSPEIYKQKHNITYFLEFKHFSLKFAKKTKLLEPNSNSY